MRVRIYVDDSTGGAEKQGAANASGGPALLRKDGFMWTLLKLAGVTIFKQVVKLLPF